IATLPASVAGVETAIPAFIGYTEKAKKDDVDGALINVPTRITSLLDFKEYFGEAFKEPFKLNLHDDYDDEGNLDNRKFSVQHDGNAPSPYNLFYSMQLYFSNGGGPCYIVSVGGYEEAIVAGSPGSGKGLIGGLETLEKVDEPTLLLFPDAVNLAGISEFGEIAKQAMAQCRKLQDRFTIIDRFNEDTELVDFRNALGMANLAYGAAYYPHLRTTLNYRVDEKASKVAHTSSGAAPGGANSLDVKALEDMKGEDPSIYRSFSAKLREVHVDLPPSGAIAGVYVRVDQNRGVWKAPANVGLNTVIGPKKKITDEQQADLNVDPSTGKSINAIRAFTGKGTLVWGARTLAGNDNEWRYIPVRRLYIYVEQSVKKASEFVVFEPNDANTWVRVKAMIENFLSDLWREGGLAGAAPDDAFFVKVGLGETMTPQDVLEGRLIVEIGMAAVRPAEFIILRFMHKLQES
ncbi:MAG: phage tail sheath C-terminal domain-containing protein, partial [Balneolales bacterium]